MLMFCEEKEVCDLMHDARMVHGGNAHSIWYTPFDVGTFVSTPK